MSVSSGIGESFFAWADRVTDEEEAMADSYNVERVHGDKECGGATKCSSCAIRFAKIFKASAGIVLAKDIKPTDTLVVAISRRLDDYTVDNAKRMLAGMLGCKVVLLPECEALAILHEEEGDNVDH